MCRRYLFSRSVSRQVSSAQMSLTSVFGMGTGGPSSQSTPTHFSLKRKVSKRNFNTFFSLPFSSTISHYIQFGRPCQAPKQGKSGDPCGNRTHVCGVRGRRLSRLTNGPCHASRLSLRHAAHHSAKTPLRCAQTAFCLRGSLCACFQAFSASFWCAFTDSNRGPTD